MYRDRFQTDWVSIILGVLMLIGGIAALRNPLAAYLTLAALVGIVAIVRGVNLILSYFKLRSHTRGNARGVLSLVLGILILVLGIYLVANPNVSTLVLGYLVAIWFISDAIQNLIVVNPIRIISPGLWVVELILNIIMLIGGIYLLFNPLAGGLAASVMLSILLMINGILTIISGIFLPKFD